MDLLTKTAMLAVNAALRTSLTDHNRPAKSGRRLTAAESRLLDTLIKGHPDASPRAIGERFAQLSGRAINRETVARRRRRRLEALAAVAAWPGWVDEITVDVPWDDEEIIRLGPAAGAIGGGR